MSPTTSQYEELSDLSNAYRCKSGQNDSGFTFMGAIDVDFKSQPNITVSLPSGLKFKDGSRHTLESGAKAILLQRVCVMLRSTAFSIESGSAGKARDIKDHIDGVLDEILATKYPAVTWTGSWDVRGPVDSYTVDFRS